MDKERIYDEVISVSISNAGAERQRNGKCLIKDFDPDNPKHMLYFEASLIYCSIIEEPLYLCMPLIKYIIFRIRHWKSRKQLKWISKTNVNEYELDKNIDFTLATTIMNFIAKWANDEFGMKEADFDKIYKEVYESYDNDN